MILLSNALAAVYPGWLRPRRFQFDRPTEALLQSLNARFLPLVWLESLAVILLHGTLMWLWEIPFWHWLATLSGFGFMWSAMQYVHHFGTERDVQKGALNLRTWRWLDLLWLNHNWHLRHHLRPTVPWIHLPNLEDGPGSPRAHLLPAYLRMWRGAKLTEERVENRYAGRIIR
jgi:fatty acid desaturase